MVVECYFVCNNQVKNFCSSRFHMNIWMTRHPVSKSKCHWKFYKHGTAFSFVLIIVISAYLSSQNWNVNPGWTTVNQTPKPLGQATWFWMSLHDTAFVSVTASCRPKTFKLTKLTSLSWEQTSLQEAQILKQNLGELHYFLVCNSRCDVNFRMTPYAVSTSGS